MKRKAYIILIAALTAATLTGCTFQFKGADDTFSIHIDNPEYGKITDEIAGEVNAAFSEELGDIIDQTDFTDRGQVDEMVQAVQEYAEDVAANNPYISEFEQAKLVRVVDGDTIVVEIDNEEYRVRLIGVNTPESVAPENYRVENTQEGVYASDFTKQLLKDTDIVWLEKDVSDTDRYGRLLRYVWMEIPEDKENINEIADKMLNGFLVYQGIALPAEYAPDTANAKAFSYLDNNAGGYISQKDFEDYEY